jgi:DNA polymerase elongation subunit (family B)
MQPSDWHEHDVSGEYVVDVFGRLRDKSVACVRIKGFKPYFYVKTQDNPGNAEKVQRYDVMAGFDSLKTISVWKVSCSSMSEYHTKIRTINAENKAIYENNKKYGKNYSEKILYESNLPPFLRLLHECHLGPGSPIQFEGDEIDIPEDSDTDEPLFGVDRFFECDWTALKPAQGDIPLKVACYDLEMCPTEGNQFPMASKDPIVQIGISYRWSNDMMTPLSKKVFVLGTVDASEDPLTEHVSCKSETDMLLKFADSVRQMNPDVMAGYNTFGFDDAYIEDRCRKLGILEEINLSRAPIAKVKKGDRWDIKFSETKKFELASGKYELRYLMMRGRLPIDLLLNMRREHSLDSFKLDSVATVFLRDKVTQYSDSTITTKSTRGLCVNNYVRFDLVGNTTDPYREGEKFKVRSVTPTTFTIEAPSDLFAELSEKELKSLEWTFTKDDVEPHELFRLHREGGPKGRARIARYCIQDCDLVLTLMSKLDTIVNARGMADVCKVPMQFVLMRGQGIKIFSAVVYYASQRQQILQVQHAIGDDEAGYEGAVVISPKIGMYLDQPISVLDFNSLYPTNMIAYNISPDTLVSIRVFDENDKQLDHLCEGMNYTGIQTLKKQGYVLDEVEYDNKDTGGKTVCTYVQPQKGNEMLTGVLPKTLEILLAKRKEFKQKMEDPKYDEAQRSVYNGLQLAYKVVANSVYGQTGSRTSPIRKLCVAACTTAAGRKALYLAKHIVESEFGAEVVYGDTDSIFIKFPTQDLAKSIELGIQAGKRITEQCRRPYKIAYEKTFYPFILFCRKRYVGMKYEEDPNPKKAKRMSMGIVLKRRDNAPIVKDVFGGALDILLTRGSVKDAQAFVRTSLLDVLQDRVPLEKFIVSKSLRDDYKNADQIAHRVLADRMAERDPGTAPKVGDRVQYVYVAENGNQSKQGDRIEHVDYVRANKLHYDATFYVDHQIQNPVAQLFALCVEQLNGYKRPAVSYDAVYQKSLSTIRGKQPDLTPAELEEEATLLVLKHKEKQIDSLMFLGSPELSAIVRKRGHSLIKGPMDRFMKKTEPSN